MLIRRVKSLRYKCNYMKRNLIISFLIVPVFAFAQTDSTTVPAEKKTYSPIIEFTSVQKNDNSVDLKAKVNAKIAGTLTKLGGLKMEFSLGTDSVKTLGETITHRNGIALLNCKGDQLSMDAEGKLNFKV